MRGRRETRGGCASERGGEADRSGCSVAWRRLK
jgi:hypothetical protein